jgi:hypothetical protein
MRNLESFRISSKLEPSTGVSPLVTRRKAIRRIAEAIGVSALSTLPPISKADNESKSFPSTVSRDGPVDSSAPAKPLLRTLRANVRWNT